MTLAYRRLSLCAALLLAACPNNNNMTTEGPDTSTSEPTTTGSPTSTPTTGEPTTTGTTTATEGTTAGTTEGSTTGPMPATCAELTDENSCGLAPACKWATIVSYTHGTQGCQGSVKDFCIPKSTMGGITTVWRDNEGDIEVLQFGFTPTDLGPEWQVCDCDGPLACLCTGSNLDCPERLDEYCGAITGENGCNNAFAAGNNVCGWFNVRPTGPADSSCGSKGKYNTCLNATNVGSNTCEEIQLNYPDVCLTPTQPVFWHEVDGEIEVTMSCGPVPVGWTQCLADDPNQPEDCKCLCL